MDFLLPDDRVVFLFFALLKQSKVLGLRFFPYRTDRALPGGRYDALLFGFLLLAIDVFEPVLHLGDLLREILHVRLLCLPRRGRNV